MMKKIPLYLLVLLLVSIVSFATVANQPQPTALYITFTLDASNSADIIWHNHESTAPGSVRFREQGRSRWQNSGIKSKTFKHTDRYIHISELRNLPAGSVIEFQLPGLTDIHTFRTLPDTITEPLKFVVGGDFMHSQEWFRDTAKQAALSYPYFVAMGGDMAYADGNPGKVNRWFDFFDIWTNTMRTPDNHIIPIIPGIGNHEVVGGYSRNNDDVTFFYDLFNLNPNRSYFNVSAGDYLSIIMLDTDHNATIEGVQTNWLSRTLQDNMDRSHVFPIYHIPAYPSFRNMEDTRSTKVRKNWVPLFEEFGVRIAFENHDHTYKRTIPLKNNETHPDGITYIGDGAWGVNLRKPNDYWYLATSASVHHFLEVRIDPVGTTVKAIRQDGTLVDQFSYNLMLTDVEDSREYPSKTRLMQNYPNPFNPVTQIPFTLHKNQSVDLSIYNLGGQKLTTLKNTTLDAGYHVVTFRPKNLPTGSYIVRLKTEQETYSRRIMYVR